MVEENLAVRYSKISEKIIDNSTKSGEISPESQLKDEVMQAKEGARSFFFHPATISIFSVLTLGLYGIGVGIHALVTKGSKPAVHKNEDLISNSKGSEIKKVPMDKPDAKSTEIPKIRSKKDLIKYLIKCCEDGPIQ